MRRPARKKAIENFELKVQQSEGAVLRAFRMAHLGFSPKDAIHLRGLYFKLRNAQENLAYLQREDV